MKTEFRPFDETTISDARKVVSTTFSPKALPLLDKILRNPLRCELGGGSAGDIAYQDGKPVAFQAAIVRRLCLGKKDIIGVVGSTLGALPETSPVILMQLMRRTIAPRYGSKLFFANTANPTSMKMNRLLGVKGRGPSTCEKIRYTCTFPFILLRHIVPKQDAVRLEGIIPGLFDRFWLSYRESCDGIVASRTAKELEWMFGENIRKGSDVLLAEFAGDIMKGYIIVRETRNGKSWMIVDMIAEHNDHKILLSLVKSAVRFIRREKSSILLESIGFPEDVDNVLRLALPFSRKAPSNSFLWQYYANPHADQYKIAWFFGPYDGDRCM